MKSRFIRMTVVSAGLLAIPALTFAGGQPAKVRMPGKAEGQDRTGITRAVQQGKGTGVSRMQTVSGSKGAESRTVSPKWSDTAFTK